MRLISPDKVKHFEIFADRVEIEFKEAVNNIKGQVINMPTHNLKNTMTYKEFYNWFYEENICLEGIMQQALKMCQTDNINEPVTRNDFGNILILLVKYLSRKEQK